MKYTVDQVTQAMKAVVEEKGENYVYPLAGGACFYADPETSAPSCIVGHVISKIDPDGFQALVDYEDGGRRGMSAYGVLQGRVSGIEPQDRILTDALRAAQSHQDSGKTWGEAYARYESWLARYDENV